MPKIKLGKVIGPQGQSISPRGIYDNSTTYQKLDLVTYQNSSYIALQETAGNLPTNTMFWQICAEGIENQNISIPNGITYIHLQEESEELPELLPINADTFQGKPIDYFATKEFVDNLNLKQWDYIVPNNQAIILNQNEEANVGQFTISVDQTSQKLLIKNADTIMLQIGTDGLSSFFHSINIENGNLNLKNSNNQKIAFKNFELHQNGIDNHLILKNSNNELLLQYTNSCFEFHKLIILKNGIQIQSPSSPNTPPFNIKYVANPEGILELRFSKETLSGETNIISFSDSQISFNAKTFITNDFTIAPNKKLYFSHAGVMPYIYTETSSGHTHFGVFSSTSGSNNIYTTMDTQGNWTFKKPIKAPNIATTMELLEAQQAITELDLQNIETQQYITDLELQTIELQLNKK